MTDVPADPYPSQVPRAERLLKSVAQVAQMLAIWRVAETGPTKETTNPAELKGHAAWAFSQFT